MTQDDYCLYTGQTVSFSDTDWESLVEIAESRLASFLCLDDISELVESNKDLAMLLANFICAILKFQGAPDEIASKQVRNFTINFKSSAADAFGQIYSQYRDIIETYSECGSGIRVERNARHCCRRYSNGYFGF